MESDTTSGAFSQTFLDQKKKSRLKVTAYKPLRHTDVTATEMPKKFLIYISIGKYF